MLAISGNKIVESKPFRWLGDTLWRGQKLTEPEQDIYFQDRKAKGFTVIQGPNTEHGTLEQLRLLADKAKLYDFYLAVVCMWKEKAESMTEAQLEARGKELAQLLPDEHILWLVLGEGTGVKRSKVNALAYAIKSLNPHQLMSIHPVGNSTSKDFDNESWLDFHCIHIGHRWERLSQPLIDQVINLGKPVIVAEDLYEDIHDGLNNNNPRFTAEQVLARAAYIMLFSKVFGYTYGANGVWQVYKGEADNKYDAQYQWNEALDLEGSKRIGELLK